MSEPARTPRRASVVAVALVVGAAIVGSVGWLVFWAADPAVPVPSVIGLDVNDAYDVVLDAGFCPHVVNDGPIVAQPPNTVWGQEPEPGSRIRRHDVVDVFVVSDANGEIRLAPSAGCQ